MSGETIQAKINKGPLSFNMSPIYIEVNGKLVGRCTSASYSHETGTPVVSLVEFKKYEESLNENQLIVLEWLKQQWLLRGSNGWSPCNVIESLDGEYEDLPGDEFETTEIPHLKAYGVINWAELFEVFEMFGKWGKKHEPI